MDLKDRSRGCLIGGAVGDALGYAIEFYNEKKLFSEYKNGITDYKLRNGVALISDDTQMTLFTANSMIFASTRGSLRGIMGPYSSYAAMAYKEWYLTQTEKFPLKGDPITWITGFPELFARRSPGNTCLSALSRPKLGTIEEPINDSKGCGGVMRVAPVGIYASHDRIDIRKVDIIAMEMAALTHGHELGYIPAAALAHIILRIARDEMSVKEAVLDSINVVPTLFENSRHMNEFVEIMNRAVSLAESSDNDLDAIHKLGEGWVAEETLAIAAYCAIKYCDDFEKGVIASVNHGGDSDSTGSVTGNILGTALGISAIPERFIEPLELKDIILELADDLATVVPVCEYDTETTEEGELWIRKYGFADHPARKSKKRFIM